MHRQDNSPDSSSQAVNIIETSVCNEAVNNPEKFFKEKSKGYRRVVDYLCEMQRKYSKIYPSVATIAKATGLTPRHVHRLLNEIEDDGLLARVRREDLLTNVYCVSSFFLKAKIRRILAPIIPSLLGIPFFFLFSTYQIAAKTLLDEPSPQNVSQRYKGSVKNINSLSSGTECNNEERASTDKKDDIRSYIANLVQKVSSQERKNVNNDRKAASKPYAPVINKSTHHKKDHVTEIYNAPPQQKGNAKEPQRPERFPDKQPRTTQQRSKGPELIPYVMPPKYVDPKSVYVGYFECKEQLETLPPHLQWTNLYQTAFDELMDEMVKLNPQYSATRLEAELYMIYLKTKIKP